MCPWVVASGRAAARVATKGAGLWVSQKHPCATQRSRFSFKTPVLPENLNLLKSLTFSPFAHILL
jgi:hypothetical protein